MPSYGKRGRAAVAGAHIPLVSGAAPEEASLAHAASLYAEQVCGEAAVRGGDGGGGDVPGEEGAGSGEAAEDGTGRTPCAGPRERPAGEKRSAFDMLLGWKEGGGRGARGGGSPEQPPTRKKACGGAGAKNKGAGGPQQVFLDFGQKGFSSRTCPLCHMVYCPGLPEEEAMHSRQHRRYTEGVEFRGWKDERVTGAFPDGSRIVCVRRGDSDAHWGKVGEVREVVQAELGSGGCGGLRRDGAWTQAHLLVSGEKRVVGFIAAEGIKRAHRLAPRLGEGGEEVLELSDREEPAVCGVAEIWVHASFRRRGAALRLLEALLGSFAPPVRLERGQVAFSQPTPAGRALAGRFFGTDSFLVYRTTD